MIKADLRIMKSMLKKIKAIENFIPCLQKAVT